MGTDDRHISFDTSCRSQLNALAAVSFKYFRVFDLRPLPQDTLHSLHSEYFVTAQSANYIDEKKIISHKKKNKKIYSKHIDAFLARSRTTCLRFNTSCELSDNVISSIKSVMILSLHDFGMRLILFRCNRARGAISLSFSSKNGDLGSSGYIGVMR